MILLPLQALLVIIPLQVLLSPFLVVFESISTINIVLSVLIWKGISTMRFPLQELLMLFSLQALIFPLQVLSNSMATIYIVSSAIIPYSIFVTLMGNTMPRAFITKILRHRSDHQFIATRSIRRGNRCTMTFGSRAKIGQAVCLIP